MATGAVTTENDGDVQAFLDAVTPEGRRRDALVVRDLMARVTGQPPRMWGASIVGFGRYHYVYATGREGDAPAAGFSPRKASTTVYLADGTEQHVELIARLGPATTSVSCLYLKRVDDVDLEVLEEIVRRSYRAITTRTWP